MNNESCNNHVQESIHPPDLIHLNIDDSSSGNPILAGNSPLSTPSDSPRLSDTNVEESEEAKKEDRKDRQQQDQQGISCLEKVSMNEHQDVTTENNEYKETNSKDEPPVDNNDRTRRKDDLVDYWDKKTRGSKLINDNENKNATIININKNEGASFDEGVKIKLHDEDEIATTNIDGNSKNGNEESAPDDERSDCDLSLDNNRDELMRSTTATIEKVTAESFSIRPHKNTDGDSSNANKPPSLTLKSPSTSSITETNRLLCDDDSSLDCRSDCVLTQRRAKTPSVIPASQPKTATTITATAKVENLNSLTMNTTNALNSDIRRLSEGTESNRLEALRRDILSLKLSLSEMDKQINEPPSTGGGANYVRTKIDDTESSLIDISATHVPVMTSLTEDNDAASTAVNKSTSTELTKGMLPVTALGGPHILSQSPRSLSILSPLCSPKNQSTDCSDDAKFLNQSINFESSTGGSVSLHELRNSSTTNSDEPKKDNYEVGNNDDVQALTDNPEHSESVKNNCKGRIDLKSNLPQDENTIETLEELKKDKEETLPSMHNSLHDEKVKRISREKVKKTTNPYRKLTPKNDLKGSDNSADWLEEELRRRAFIKSEINNAILARGGNVVEELPSFSPLNLQSSHSTDEEVAAITARDNTSLSIGEPTKDSISNNNNNSLIGNNINGPIPRKLDYREYENEDRCAEDTGNEENNSGFQNPRQLFDFKDIQHEMKKFASETRGKLREHSFTDIENMQVSLSSPASLNNRSLGADKSTADPNVQLNTLKIDDLNVQANEVPVILRSMDSFEGIAFGDISLSLLSENTGRAEASVAATWANRVHGAIWRARRMRRNVVIKQCPPDNNDDTDGCRTISSLQQAALAHLNLDEIDQCINLTEAIVFAYYAFVERSVDNGEKNLASDADLTTIDFKKYIGIGLHNLGVLNLLKGDYDEALSYFIRAVENKKGHLSDCHPDYISSLVKLAICRYARNEFADAHARLEEALDKCSSTSHTTLEDRLLMAEILNNLGCLAYMSGQPASASSYYRDSMDLQFGALSDSLYIGNSATGRSISLNISISRGNIGFLKLVTKELSVGITALENTLMEQQILLKGAHDTIIATMDHLALSNLLNGDQEKAALMFNRILQLQQDEYGPHDRRCFVTVDKINMVQSKGVQYEDAIEELRKTFSMPSAKHPSFTNNTSIETKVQIKVKHNPPSDKTIQHPKTSGKSKNKKNKVMKVFSSLRKKTL